MTTKIIGSQITNYTVNTEQLSNTAVAAFAQSLAPKITSVNVANSAYTILDDTAVNVGGGYIVITGSDFQSGASVLIDTVSATSVTYVNTSTLQAEVPARSAATYNLYVVNPDGGTGIRVNGLTYSGVPTWVTTSPLANQQANVAFNLSFSATSATSYSNTTALPAGTTLLANGYFFGTVTIGAETTYTFTVRATDAELQDADRTFQVTVTVTPARQLFTFGDNTQGQLGHNDRTRRSSPVQVGSTTTWANVNISFGYTLATRSDGTLWAWGQNFSGELGLNDRIYRSSPVQVGADTTWNLVNNGQYSSLATKTNGTLWVWGHNGNGRLGLNDTVYRSSPTQLGTASNWKFLSGSIISFQMATKTDGTLWAWGGNANGQLGVNDRLTKSSPVQVGADTTWNRINSGRQGVLATKTDGTLWSWGFNNYGQLGTNNLINRSSPVQVGADTTWSLVGMGQYFSVATKTNGTLWSWGGAGFGKLGLNSSTLYRSSPTQVGTDTTWSSISVGFNDCMAIKTNGTLWGWGSNDLGQSGVGTSTSISSPVQIGSNTTWVVVEVSKGAYASTIAIRS